MAKGKSKYTVRCDVHGTMLPVPYTGDGKEVVVGPPKGKNKHRGCSMCRKEREKT